MHWQAGLSIAPWNISSAVFALENMPRKAIDGSAQTVLIAAGSDAVPSDGFPARARLAGPRENVDHVPAKRGLNPQPKFHSNALFYWIF